MARRLLMSFRMESKMNNRTHFSPRRMRSENGSMSAEFALLLPVFILLMVLLVEGSNVVHAYASLVEASREGARAVLRDGDSNAVANIVQALTADLPGGPAVASISSNAAGNTVTVEVGYEYQSFTGQDAFKAVLGPDPLVIKARTTMPLP